MRWVTNEGSYAHFILYIYIWFIHVAGIIHSIQIEIYILTTDTYVHTVDFHIFKHMSTLKGHIVDLLSMRLHV